MTEDKVKKFVQAFQSPEVAKAAEDEFKGGAIKEWQVYFFGDQLHCLG